MCLGCVAGAAIVGMQMAFTPTTHDLQTIAQYRTVIETSYQTNHSSIRTIDERLKTLYKKSSIDEKTKRYAEQLRSILCETEPLTCPLVVTQSL